jgi:D-alanine--poly(phosphoribitol) ligase subunit 1
VSHPPYYTNAAAAFADVARAAGQAPALRWTVHERTTYGDLDALANRVARVLLRHGVRKRDTVALATDKAVTTYAAMLACLKIGAPYFAIDPTNPRPRQQSIVDRCAPAVALIGSAVDAAPFRCPTLPVPDGGTEPGWIDGVEAGDVEPPWSLDGSDPAYVMFTSGSTGAPKGATISHGNLVNFIQWARRHFAIAPDDVLTGVNPLFFDNSVFDTYASLFAGASLAPVTRATLRDPHALVAQIDALGCTVYFSVPSLLLYFQRLKLVGRASFPSLRTIVFGGEGYPKPWLARLYEAIGDRVELHNVYGPTECTCICSAYRVSAVDFADLRGYAPLGHVLPNFSYVVVDATGRAVAPGDLGELYLGGPCVGLGYYDAPDLTAHSFVQNPTHDRFREPMYRTGDLVRCDPATGHLHFVGRADTQIKHQGHRIELGEIEHALTALAGVEEAAAVHVAGDETSRIVAVVASRAGLTPAAIKAHLTAALPRYMVPDQAVVVADLPKNANGKVDRRSLAAQLAGGNAERAEPDHPSE